MPFARRHDGGILGQPSRGISHLVNRCADSPACRHAIARETSLRTAKRWLAASDHLDISASPLPMSRRIPVWVWLQYASQPPRRVQLNLNALHRHAPPAAGFRIRILNSSTLKRWVELPPEFHQLARQSAASDIARVALLARFVVATALQSLAYTHGLTH